MSRDGESRGVAELLNGQDVDLARRALGGCCGARRWVEGMLVRRPFAEGATLFGAAEEVWWSLAEEDWLEAFSHHPRIGERKAARTAISQESISQGAATSAATSRVIAEASAKSQEWSRQEQAAVASADESLQAALEAGNRAYEEKFGYVFLIRAAGRGGEEILAELRRRLNNDAAAEIRQAASQQAEITALRLAKLTDESIG